ncbi:MAG: hypothetical protein ACAI35_00280 [Candidatus Methylacidiphilales bacterium]|nr:hypothetical protein [Candidatus Methylacidiphilales bacterium]
MRSKSKQAFSLVELALALGVVSFALVSVLALLLVGVRSNQISMEETRATYLLSVLEADLRNTHPLLTEGDAATAGKSLIYKLQLPYYVEPGTEKYVVNPDIQPMATTLILGTTTTGINDADKPVNITSSNRPGFQATIIYTSVPAANNPDTLQARLIVNWPSMLDTDPAILTDLNKVKGFVEATVSFPAP